MGEQQRLLGIPGNGKNKAAARGKEKAAPQWLTMQSTGQLFRLLDEVTGVLHGRGLRLTYRFEQSRKEG